MEMLLCKPVCDSIVSALCCLGPKPEREFEICHDVHPGVKGRSPGQSSPELSGISASISQQQPCQVINARAITYGHTQMFFCESLFTFVLLMNPIANFHMLHLQQHGQIPHQPEFHKPAGCQQAHTALVQSELASVQSELMLT